MEYLGPPFRRQPSMTPSAFDGLHGRRVLVTGHTGFKGSWLALWLSQLGAEVHGFSLPPEEPSLFAQAGVAGRCRGGLGDLRDPEQVCAAVAQTNPEFVFHLAAQTIVRRGYAQPAETIAVNILGTAHLLDAVRSLKRPVPVLVVTSDKCYEDGSAAKGCREEDRLGGRDPYSMSKAGQELVAASYRASYDMPIATARSGNVIGGGDWAENRLVPDIIRSLTEKRPLFIRNPDSVRPWQHVLEPLCGYLHLAAKLLGPDAASHCEAWNFGPAAGDDRPVKRLADEVLKRWGSGSWEMDPIPGPAETDMLRLNSAKAVSRLGWRPRWDFDEAVSRTVAWYRAQAQDASQEKLARLCLDQIGQYSRIPASA